MVSSYLVHIALLFADLASAFRAFEPNCTAPRDHVTWVSPPSVRGTMEIIFSCFSVLLVCTWAIQHLSVPPHRDHYWNHKLVESKQYSAFLDDARFNYSKLKWMVMSLIAPEYILSKSLSEMLAAHDSRRHFVALRKAGLLSRVLQESPDASNQREGLEKRDCSTTHGYFANMGGFILRFDTESVKLDPTPLQPTENERSLFIRNPSNDPPYEPQDPFEAEARELKHCRDGSPCENHPDATFPAINGVSKGSNHHDTSNLTHQKRLNGTHPLLTVSVDERARTTSTENLHTSPRSLSPQPSSEDFTILTPNTLVDQPLLSPSSPSASLVNRHGYPVNLTPTTGTSSQEFPFVGKTSPKTQDHELQTLEIQPSINGGRDNRSKTPAAHGSEKEQLVPHKKWRATWALNSMQMLYAIEQGIIPLPDTSAEDLNDKSKGDALVKGLAVLHISWLTIQIVVRGAEGLAITQLEIMVLGFSACAIVTYFLLWHKPQDVKIPTYIDLPHSPTREQIIQLAARSPVATLMAKQFWLHGVAIRAMADNIFPWTPGIRFKIPHLMDDPIYLNPHLIGIGGGGALFGGIHVATWNFVFPTPVERLLWRISAAYLVSIPLVGVIIYLIIQHIGGKRPNMTDTVTDKLTRPIGRVAIPLYLLARLYLLVEVFRCLAYPPPSAFQDVAWPSIIPHIN